MTVLNVAYPHAPIGPDAVGGAEQILTAVSEAIARAGHRSLVLACAGSTFAAGELFAVPRMRPPRGAGERRRFYAGYRAEIERVVAAANVDVVHCHGVDFHGYLPRAPLPVLATLHLPPAWYPAEVFTPSRPRTYLNCVSPSQRRACPDSPALLADVPNGIALSQFRPGPTRAEFALVLARVCPEKGLHLALEAARRANLPLIMAGEVFEHPEHQRYFAEEVRPRCDESRRFVGPVGLAEKAALLARARCLVVPSLVAETSSLVTMEALGSGTPVVAFAKGALPDLIEHGRTGFLVNDVDEMAAAMRAAAQLRPGLCRHVAEQRFSAEAMCAGYLRHYERIRSAAPPRLGLGKAGRRSGFGLACELVTKHAAITALADEWQALWQLCPRATVFTRPAWLLPWLTHLLAGEPQLVTVRRAGRLVALAPFFRWQAPTGRVLSLMGAGVSDYCDLLVLPEEAAGVVAVLGAFVADHLAWNRAALSEVPDDSLLKQVFALAAPPARQDVCPGLNLRTLPPKPPRIWKKLAHAARRLDAAAGRAGWRIERATAASLSADFAAFAELHSERWQGAGAAFLADQRTLAFHNEATAALLAADALCFYLLRVGDDVAGVLYVFQDRAADRAYASAVHPRYARFGPGVLLVGHAIEAARERGAEQFDFLRGAEPHKYRWGATDVRAIFHWEKPRPEPRG